MVLKISLVSVIIEQFHEGDLLASLFVVGANLSGMHHFQILELMKSSEFIIWPMLRVILKFTVCCY